MFLSRTKLMTIAAAVTLTTGLAGHAPAAPPPGMRWSDQAFGTSSRSQSYRVTPSYYSYPAPVVAGGAAGPSTAAPATVAVRGPDGVVRNYSVEGGALVQRQTGVPGQAAQMVTVRDADGVLRSYPAATNPATPGQVTVGQPAVVTVWRCR